MFSSRSQKNPKPSKKIRILRIIPRSWHAKSGAVHAQNSRWALFSNSLKNYIIFDDIFIIPRLRFLGYYISYFIGALELIFRAIFSPHKIIVSETAFSAPLAYVISRFGGKKWIADWFDVASYSPTFVSAKRRRKLKYFLVILVEKTLLKFADAVITSTLETHNRLLRKGYRNIYFISNGVDISRFSYSPSHKLNFVLFYHGKLIEEYNVERLVRILKHVVKKYPQTRLHIVGAGESEPKLRKMAKDLGITSNIIFHGLVPFEKLPEYIAKADICILPFDSPALKVWEWAASGKPIVAYGTTLEDVHFKEGESFLAPKVGSEDMKIHQMAELIIMLFENDELRVRIGKNARALAEKRSLNYMRRRFLKLLSMINIMPKSLGKEVNELKIKKSQILI